MPESRGTIEWIIPTKRCKEITAAHTKQKKRKRTEKWERRSENNGTKGARVGSDRIWGIWSFQRFVVLFFVEVAVGLSSRFVYFLRNRNRPVSRMNCASSGYTCVVLSRDGSEKGFTFTFSSLINFLNCLRWGVNSLQWSMKWATVSGTLQWSHLPVSWWLKRRRYSFSGEWPERRWKMAAASPFSNRAKASATFRGCVLSPRLPVVKSAVRRWKVLRVICKMVLKL